MTVDISRFLEDGLGIRKQLVKRVLSNPSEPISPALDLNNSILFWSAQDYAISSISSAKLNEDGTEILGGGTSYIVEFYPGLIKSIQRGSTPNLDWGSISYTDISISEVNINKSIIICNCRFHSNEDSGTETGRGGIAQGSFLSSTSIRISLRQVVPSYHEVPYQVIEFY
jgi:hypothetical protein